VTTTPNTSPGNQRWRWCAGGSTLNEFAHLRQIEIDGDRFFALQQSWGYAQ
jgi:hypothetical protein